MSMLSREVASGARERTAPAGSAGPATEVDLEEAVATPPDALRGLNRPAELASLASRADTGGTAAVEFEVAHVLGDPVGLGAERARPPVETLSFAAGGLRVEVATWPAASPDVATSHELSESTVLGGKPVRLVHPEHGWRYRGSAMLNPGFFHDPSRSLEVLVSLGGAPWYPSHRDTLMLTRTLRHLAQAAATCGLPILSLTSPAAPTSDAVGATRGDGSGEKIRSPFAPCVRMVLGLDADRPRARLEFELGVAGYAAEHGLALRLGDRRAGRSRGEWFSIAGFDGTVYRERRDELFGWAPDVPPTQALVATAHGPARIGATVTLSRWLERSNVGCLGASLTVLQDIAFVNLLLPVAPARTGGRPAPATVARAVTGLGPVASRSGLTTEQGTHREGKAQAAIDTRAVTDYLLLVSDPMPCTFERRSRGGIPAVVPLWVAWDMPASDLQTADVLRAVTEALAGHTGAIGVAFARGRRGERGRLIGRAKLTVAPGGGRNEPVSAALGAMAARAQDTAARKLALQLGMQAADVRLQVAWRERWLAHLGTGV